MASKAEVLASIADGSIFKTAEHGRTARIKSERIDKIAGCVVSRILFVGPPKPISKHDDSDDDRGYGRGQGVYHGD